MDASINREEVVFHGIEEINSGHYWTIDDEQLYDIRRQVKTYVPDEANDNNLPDCNQPLSVAGNIEPVVDETETDTDGYIHPIISVFINNESEGRNVLRNKENSFSWQDCHDFQVKAKDIKPTDFNTCLLADGDMEHMIDCIEMDTEGYLQPIALNSTLKGKNFLRNIQNSSAIETRDGVPVVIRECSPSNGIALLHAEGSIETLLDWTETDTDEYQHPIISEYINSELKVKNVLRKSHISSSGQDCDDIQLETRDTNASHNNPCLPAQLDTELIEVAMEPDTDGYIHATIPIFLDGELDGKNALRNNKSHNAEQNGNDV